MASFQQSETPHIDMSSAEDPMELSSEMNPSANAEDIDIDLMTNDVYEREDDFMAEDLISVADQELPDVEAPQAGNDDEMFDDEYPSGEFQENLFVHDEDLEDAEESVIVESADTIIATVKGSPAKQIVQSHFQVRPQEEIIAANANMEPHQDSLEVLRGIQEPAAPSGVTGVHNQANAGPQVASAQGDNLPGDLGHGPIAPVDGNDAIEEKLEDSAQILTTLADEQEPSVLAAKTQDAITNQDESLALNLNLSQYPAYIHPVVVVYQDNEMSLFPPIDQDQEHSQTYFLQDESHAAKSINCLLGACRSVLGESINEQDELEIQIEELGLHLSEFAPESSTTTLAEILDIYVQLHRYDGNDNPGPLYIVLCTKIRFSQRMRYLINAASEGKGFSQLSLLEPPDDGDPQSEDLEEQDATGKGAIQETDCSKNAEEAKDLPISVRGDDQEREEANGNDDRRIALNTQNVLRESTRTTGTWNDRQVGITPLGDEGKSPQLSGSKEERAALDEAGTKVEQGLIQKVEETSRFPSPADADEHALRESEETAAEEEDLINYEDEEGEEGEEAEDDTNRELSTRSSTIQGDSIEASRTDVATATENVLDNEPAESINEQPQEDDHQQRSVGQDQIEDGSGDLFEADEVDKNERNGSLGVGDGDFLDFDQDGEDLELELDKQEEQENEQIDMSGAGHRNEPDVPNEGTDREDVSAEERKTEPILTHKPTKEYQGEGYQEEDLRANEPSGEHHGGDVLVGLNGHENSDDNDIDFTVDHAETGEGTETFKTDETLSNGYGHDSDQDQESRKKLPADSDEINYEDDEGSSKIPAGQSLNLSPGSLKRTRSNQADDDLLDDPQDLKRIRSE